MAETPGEDEDSELARLVQELTSLPANPACVPAEVGSGTLR
jgi:hypothetical protein